MKDDCIFLDDIECPYADRYKDCVNCNKYLQDIRKHPLDDSVQADYLRDMEKDRLMMEGEE